MIPVLFAAVAITTTNLTWHDTTRERDVPVKIYAPSTVTNPGPLIVFSHGLGGTREGCAYLGRHWAERGYICVHVQHPGSDAGIFSFNEDALATARRAAMDPDNWRDRPLDVSFAITQMQGDRRVDRNVIGVAGHSFGAHTAQLIIGRRVADESYRDARVKAAIAMSPNRPASARALRDMNTPCLYLTGTEDDSPVFPAKPEDRRYVFDHVTATDQWFINLKGAHHFTFSDNPLWGGKRLERDPRHHPWICEITTRFWDAFLKGDAEAKTWLTGANLLQLLRDNAVIERK